MVETIVSLIVSPVDSNIVALIISTKVSLKAISISNLHSSTQLEDRMANLISQVRCSDSAQSKNEKLC